MLKEEKGGKLLEELVMKCDFQVVELVENEPAISIASYFLIIGDLHIGAMGIGDRKMDELIVQQMIIRIKKLRRLTNARGLIITGDLKERIGLPRSKLEIALVENFLRTIAEIFDEIVIIKGNHDGMIERIISNLEINNKMLITKRLLIISTRRNTKILIVHGHVKLKSSVIENLGSELIIISSHTHPAVSILPSLKLKAWGIFEVKLMSTKFKWIILPAFNEVLIGLDLSSLSDQEIIRISPFPSDAKILKKSFLLLDLTPIID